MWSFGTNFQGRIRKVGGQAIKTRFFHIMWMPVIPLGSWFVIEEHSSWLIFRKADGYPVGWNLKSILLAYPRRYLGLFFFGGSAGMLIELFEEGIFQPDLFVGLLVFGVLWTFFMFFLGQATPAEVYDRSLLGLATGEFAYPDWMPEDAARDVFEQLEADWQEEHPDQSWRGALSARNTGSESIPALFSLALFARRLEPGRESEFLEEAARRWAHLELSAEDLAERVEEEQDDDGEEYEDG